MTLEQAIKKEDWVNLWANQEVDLSEIANNFYTMFAIEEVYNWDIITRFNLRCLPIVKNLIYDIKRFNLMNEFKVKNTTTKSTNTTNQTNTELINNTTDKTQDEATDKNSYVGGLGVNVGDWTKNNMVSNSTNESTNNTNQTNNFQGTNNETEEFITINDVRNWVSHSYDNKLNFYLNEIRDILLIEVW